MVDEEERRQHVIILSSLYDVLQERKQAHTSQGDVSGTADGRSNEESSDLPYPDTASSPDCTHSTDNEAAFPLLMSSSIACDDAVPRTSRAGLEEAAPTEYVSSDEAWNGILNDWYEKTMGNPPNPQVPVANVNAEQNASKHQDEGESFHVGQIHAAENRTTLPQPVCSSGSFDYAVPSTSCTVIGASACGESTVR
ncbi:hypothetical protein MRX96_014987 [Rhipicephalus microplus]